MQMVFHLWAVKKKKTNEINTLKRLVWKKLRISEAGLNLQESLLEVTLNYKGTVHPKRKNRWLSTLMLIESLVKLVHKASTRTCSLCILKCSPATWKLASHTMKRAVQTMQRQVLLSEPTLHLWPLIYDPIVVASFQGTDTQKDGSSVRSSRMHQQREACEMMGFCFVVGCSTVFQSVANRSPSGSQQHCKEPISVLLRMHNHFKPVAQ